MPSYEYRCGNKHEVTKFFRVRDYVEAVDCEQCDLAAVRIFTAPVVKVAQDIAYTSPIDGKVITTHAARQDDLKRYGCVPFDQDTEQEVARVNKELDSEFDRTIDQTVEESICRMPEKKRVQLTKEVLEYGTDLAVSRPEVVA